MSETSVVLVGVPLDCGKARKGCVMGPDAYRIAGLEAAVAQLGYRVRDAGNVAPQPHVGAVCANAAVHSLNDTIGWSQALRVAAHMTAGQAVPIFMGGDHALSIGTVAGMSAYAAAQDRPLFVLWLDAHTDLHTPLTTASGNLHGTPLAYIAGRTGFDGFPVMPAPVPDRRIGMIGLRSVDAAERQALSDSEMTAVDMRMIDERGIAAPLAEFLARVDAENGLLHVSLDVDFLDPDIAPAVGTTVPGGASLREAHLVMEMLHDTGRVASLDLVELNPFLDERGRTAHLMVDLVASLFGRRVFDRPTRSHS